VDQIMALIVAMASSMAKRVSESCADWPDWANPEDLLTRIPGTDSLAAGLDAMLACALWLVPEEAWSLSAGLHVNWNSERVNLIRAAIAAELPPDHPVTWWAAMCRICKEGEVDQAYFLRQIAHAHLLRANSTARREAAHSVLEEMRGMFSLTDEGYPIGTADGCLQGMYVSGFDWGVHDARGVYGIFFIGTCQSSLGLEDFEWGTEEDDQGRPKSGPVFGSPQFVKCADEAELERALAVVREKLGPAKVPKGWDKVAT
jgi:hypothetical protein